MPSRAILFPGQGAQTVGMGRDLAERFPRARAVFDRANAALGFDLAQTCFDGPPETLNRTDVAQPAILVASIAALEALGERTGVDRIEADATAGLSLGEYTALVYAESLRFEDAVRLVRLRGEAMQADCDRQPSAMASVLMLDREKVEEACRRAAETGVVVTANLLGPGNIVISGATAAVEKAGTIARELGARRVIPLKVAGAFHSPLMSSAEARLKEALGRIEIRSPRCPVIANAEARAVTSAEDIRACLGKQVTSAVRWEDSMRVLLGTGIRRFLEIGPGTVLTGLMGKIDGTAGAVAVGSVEAVERAVSQG
ncbi:MAG: ACP S-malonyltransferase [Planctomycetes bacterium]|nr:ACP S-malonyltransferase [Planctomycetota bacterium]